MITSTKAQLAVARDSSARALATPSIAQVREVARTEGRVGAPSDAEAAMQHKAGTDYGKLYSEALRGKVKHTLHTLTVSSKESKSDDTIKEILKSNINPTKIKVGINALKTLRNGKVQIEAQNKPTSCSGKIKNRIQTNEMGIKNTNITTDTTQTDIKCLQINLQHSRAATANLIEIVTDDEIDIIFIQEP